jgi:hypothetical protein
MLYCWQEILPLLDAGYITVPPGVTIVFTDAGSGYVRTDGMNKYGHGVYYHTMMLDGTANQLSEMVPASRIASQLLGVINASLGTTALVDNISDLKPAPMTTLAVFNLAWNPQPWNATQDFNATARAWYAKFAMDYYGVDAANAAQIALVWDGFFNVPYIFGGNSDNIVAQLLVSGPQDIAKAWAAGKGVPSSVVGTLQGNANRLGAPSAAQLLSVLNSTAWALLSAVPAHRRGFYASHLLLQLQMHTAGMNALNLLVQAAQALQPSSPGGPAPDPSNGLALVTQALAGIDAMMALRRVTEGDAGAWANAATPLVNIGAAFPLGAYYNSDELSNMNAVRGSLNTLLISLKNPLGAPLLPVRPPTWYRFENYQQQLAPNYPLAAFNPAWNFATYCRTNCRVSDVTAGTCTNGPDGGRFVKGSAASVTFQIMTSDTEPHPSTRAAMKELRRLGLTAAAEAEAVAEAVAAGDTVVLHYTTDGSDPTINSPAYVPGSPPTLTSLLPSGQSSVTIKAMGWIDGVATNLITTTNWTAW